jgi:hypothetical protein
MNYKQYYEMPIDTHGIQIIFVAMAMLTSYLLEEMSESRVVRQHWSYNPLLLVWLLLLWWLGRLHTLRSHLALLLLLLSKLLQLHPQLFLLLLLQFTQNKQIN